MAINFTVFNGTCPYIDSAKFEIDIKAALGVTCKNAQVFLLNNFPIDVSTESGIDFLLVIALERVDRNYFYFKRGNNKVYIHNLIIPVRVITNLQSHVIVAEDDYLRADDCVLDYSDELSSLGFSLRDYLSDKCKFTKEDLFISPLAFIVNKNKAVSGHLLSYESFSWEALLFYFKNCDKDIFISYKSWMQGSGYDLLGQDIKRVVEQASKDSAYGYITKKKVERMSREMSEEREIFKDVNKRLIIIEGKAGTGKTSEIIMLMMRCVDHGRNSLFLTYNKLLVNDIAKTIKSYISGRKDKDLQFRAEHMVTTLHKFIRKISRSLGVLHLMSDERILEIHVILNKRSDAMGDFIDSFAASRNVKLIDYKVIESIKNELQRSDVDRGTKEIGIDLLNFIKKKRLEDPKELWDYVDQFVAHKRVLLAKIEGDKIFLSDYYEVLKNTLLAIRKPKDYFSKYDVSQKFDLLEQVLNLKDKHTDLDGEKKLINEEAFLANISNRKIRNRRERTLFVDEAQDCHYIEREILLSIFGPENVVVSSGGYEQLIRHVELCKWDFFDGKQLIRSRKRQKNKKEVEHDASQALLFDLLEPDEYDNDENEASGQVVFYRKVARTFRMKKTILDFCNYFADECGIDLQLSPVSSEDTGTITFDFRKDGLSSEVKAEMDKLLYNADLHGCTPYESLLILIDAEARMARSNRGGLGEEFQESISTAVINEYGNIEDSVNKQKKEWEHKSTFLSGDIMLWDGSVDDKNELGLPSPTECRMLYYESCRGLEAWSVACFKLDRFFNQKRDHVDAEKFLIESERKGKMQDLDISNEERKRMFAGTWTLMALTRAMDSLYISIDDPNSDFGMLVLSYIQTNPKNVKVLI